MQAAHSPLAALHRHSIQIHMPRLPPRLHWLPLRDLIQIVSVLVYIISKLSILENFNFRKTSMYGLQVLSSTINLHSQALGVVFFQCTIPSQQNFALSGGSLHSRPSILLVYSPMKRIQLEPYDRLYFQLVFPALSRRHTAITYQKAMRLGYITSSSHGEAGEPNGSMQMQTELTIIVQWCEVYWLMGHLSIHKQLTANVIT